MDDSLITYEEVESKMMAAFGAVPHILGAYKEIPNVIEGHMNVFGHIMMKKGLPLSRYEREYLAVETSNANTCEYCISHHTSARDKHVEESNVTQEQRDALKKLAFMMAKDPSTTPTLKKEFLEAGYDEKQWLHAISVCSYFNFANRIVLSLDLPLEEGHETILN
mmetsp:Transcript_13919/g.15373  ORF Transcript_13919/g.15373 Transcript_13919/m.15373 type:complete len:165 (+) Transcript_13919:185-679(+)|eukprot:CAMPEP_0114993680 /NCGR_PEP_ID=MMETSP0216-20121206/12676_1 /TAXON_ID=223996 /ORGANISM="Protocruzia adherens, Strain Boccale" /LENGTH=164 /DNA_ID=CAMNT_0002357373 /DNA_START=71 /DNA_END=565 /DNA_ORIENTATION=+